MRWLLDTNVISELVRPVPDPQVVKWVGDRSPLDLALSVLTVGELAKGIHGLGAGRRRAALEGWLATELPRQFAGRLLPVDTAVALRWGELSSAGRRAGRPLPVIDGLLLATAAVHELALVTRDTAECTGRGIEIVDPWSP